MEHSSAIGAQVNADLSARVRMIRGEFELDVDLWAPAGEVTAVVGPNGSGKSTLLRALSGLSAITAGRIVLGDDLLDDGADAFVAPEYRRIGSVFQDYLLFPHLSTLENIAFGLRCQGICARAAREQAHRWLAEFDLADLADRRPARLSGGQAQRVALVRALATQPRALLLDEPLAALDAGTRSRLRGELGRRLREFHGPTVLVTHEPLEALVLADRLCVIEHGRVVQAGSVAEVAARPVSAYVAALMGVNLLRGESADGRIMVNSGGELIAAGAPDGQVLATIRPSAITVHRAPPEGSARNAWRAVVESIEDIGDRVRVSFTGAPSVLVDLTAVSLAQLRLSPGEQVWLSVKATEIDVYPAP